MSKDSEPHFDREGFLKKHNDIRLKEKVEKIEKRDPDFWTNLEKIRSHYLRSISGYKSKLSLIINEISQADINKPTIHSIRYRVKDTDSLLVKIIEKSDLVPEKPQGNPEIEKYRHLTPDNYYKIITDLVGVRILIRYRYQWKAVHDLIWELYHNDDREYIRDWEAEYINNPGLKFIAEQPRAYVKLDSDRSTYEAIGKNIFHILTSENHYASLHYLVNLGGTYVELQVRTIFDEAWCECNHDFVYKARVNSASAKKNLERLSIILAQHTTASEEIVSLMCDIANPPRRKPRLKSHTEEKTQQDTGKSSKTFAFIRQRALLLSQQNNSSV